MKLCCDCRVSEGLGSEKVVWYLPDLHNSRKGSFSTSLTSARSFGVSRLSANRSHVTLPTAKLDLSHFRTGTGSIVDLSLPEKMQSDESALEAESIRQLKRQNSQYVQIIKSQLIPLKKQYQSLLQEYEKKAQLVALMNSKLQKIEQEYCSRPTPGKVKKKLKKPHS